uniref:Uncharacterized protein n=1 Tax=Anopheles atroparvus TaxID=41427 RepID=A0AAG5DTP8_ANOAO
MIKRESARQREIITAQAWVLSLNKMPWLNTFSKKYNSIRNIFSQPISLQFLPSCNKLDPRLYCKPFGPYLPISLMKVFKNSLTDV